MRCAVAARPCFCDRTLLVNIRERKRAKRHCDFQLAVSWQARGRLVLISECQWATDPMLCRA